EELAARIERLGNLLNESALGVNGQYKHQPPGNDGIKRPAEEVRILGSRALRLCRRKPFAEFSQQRRRCIHSIDLETFVDQRLRRRDTMSAGDLENRATGTQGLAPLPHDSWSDARVAGSNEVLGNAFIAVRFIVGNRHFFADTSSSNAAQLHRAA